jgi:hypothetical protein
MIIDGSLLFTGTSNGATGGITASPTTDAPTTGTQVASNIIDLGLVNGVPSYANGGGARDIGVGDNPALKFLASVAVTFAGGTSLQLELSGAPDSGTGTPGAYYVMWLGPAILLANLDQGQELGNINIPRATPGQPLPRFLRLRFISVGSFTAGQVCAAIVLDRMDHPQGLNGNLSGYRPGVVVSN